MLKLTQFPKKKFAKKGKPFRLKCNAGNFQCGGSCKNIAYKNKAGQMAYTKCGKNAEGGAKTGLEWLQYVKSRRQRLKGKFGDKFTVDATGKVIRRRNQPQQAESKSVEKVAGNGGALTVQTPGADMLYAKLQDGLQKANKLIKEKSSPSLESLRDRLQFQIAELEQQKPELKVGALAKREKPAPDDTPLPREEKSAPKRDNSRFGRLLQQMEETEIEDAKNTAGILGVAGKLYETVERLSGVKGTDREVELPEIDTTETPKRKFSKLIDDLDDLNKEDVQNTAKALGVAGKLFQTVQGLADRMDSADSGLPTSKPAPALPESKPRGRKPKAVESAPVAGESEPTPVKPRRSRKPKVAESDTTPAPSTTAKQSGAKTTKHDTNSSTLAAKQEIAALEKELRNLKGTTKPKIKTYDEFKSVAMETHQGLRSNMGDFVPIYEIRRAIGDRVSRKQFNEWMLKMRASKDISLFVGSARASLSQVEDGIYNKSLNQRYFHAVMSSPPTTTSKNKPITPIPDSIADQIKAIEKRIEFAKTKLMPKIKGYDEFIAELNSAFESIGNDYNYTTIPIDKIRNRIGARVTDDQFDEWMIKARASKTYVLHEDTAQTSQTDGYSGGYEVHNKPLNTFYALISRE